MAKYIVTDEDVNFGPFTQCDSIDFNDINAKLMGNIEAHCHQWLPCGKVKGGSYRIGGIDGSLGSSMSINLRTGQWYDHATDDKGGDLVSLYAAVHNLTQIEAAKELQSDLNIVRLHPNKKPKVPIVSESQWEHALTQPTNDAPRHWEHGKAHHVYKYADTAGRPVGAILRWDLADGKKEIRQISWMRHKKTNRCTWRWQAFIAPRPLYRGELLEKMPNADVIVVEGEKAADALADKLPSHVVVSWAGGSKAINQSDWSVLEGRNVAIWGDNDAPGREAAKQVQEATQGDIIDAPSDKPEGWDAADAVAEGWTTEALEELIASSKARQAFNVLFGNEGAPKSLEEATARRPDVIIDGLLYEKSKLLIGGVAKAGKSHFAMSLAASMATGSKFLEWKAVQPQKVLYVDFELHQWELNERCASACNWDVPANLARLSLRQHYDVRSTTDINRVLKAIDAAQFDVIILDCLYKFNSAEDENDNAAMKAIGAWLDEIIAKYGVTPILIHHFGKGGQAGKDVIDRFRGASSIVGEMDGLISIISHENEGCYIVDSVVRSFKSTPSFVARWDYPHWVLSEDLDASRAARPGAKKKMNDDELLSKIPVGEENKVFFEELELGITEKTFRARTNKMSDVIRTKKNNSSNRQQNAYHRHNKRSPGAS
jgi:hypothetical protein